MPPTLCPALALEGGAGLCVRHHDDSELSASRLGLKKVEGRKSHGRVERRALKACLRKSMDPKIFKAKRKSPPSERSELVPLPGTAKVFTASNTVIWPIYVSELTDPSIRGNNMDFSLSLMLSPPPSFPPSAPESRFTKKGNMNESTSHCPM